jgi:DHA1 family tetracycline resistance protein-like MFS transporter
MTSPVRAPKAALAFVAVSLLLDSLAQSIAFPILPRLAQHLAGGDTAAASRWVGWLEVGWAAPQFLAAPALGLLSDRLGRRPVIVAGVLGVGAELALNALAPNVWWLLAGRMLCGVTCGAQAAAMAYVADVTAPDERAGAFGRMTAAIWAGIIAGPALGGLLARIDLRAPFWAAAGVALLAGVWGLVALPESRPASARGPVDWRGAIPWRSLGLLSRRGALPWLAAALALTWLAFQGKDNMLVLYAAYCYGWDPLRFGLFAAALAGGTIAVQAGLAGRIAQRWGERRATLAGMALQALGMAGMGFAPDGARFIAANALCVVGGVANPAMQALLSREVGPDEQGRLQGAIGQVGSFASIAAPVAFTQLFAWTVSAGRGVGWSGATILVAAAMTILAAACAGIATRSRSRA